MHYFRFNISDWHLATSHLTLEEEAIYFRLIKFYYDTETPIPTETQSVLRRLRLGSHAEAVGMILSEFFMLEPDGWHHKRCDQEILEYQQKAEKNRSNGKKGGRPLSNQSLKATKPTGNPVGSQMEPKPNPNITLTTNHKPLSIDTSINTEKTVQKTKKPTFTPSDMPELPEDVAIAFIQHRKALRAPLTRIAWEGICKEAGKARISPEEAVRACITQGWRGFKAEWMANNTRGEKNGTSEVDNSAPARVRRAIEQQRREREQNGGIIEGDFERIPF